MALDLLVQLSNAFAELAARGAASVVRVDARPHRPASGVVWSADGLVVTAHHALARDEDVSIGLPSGETVQAEVVGADAATDLALLRVSVGGLTVPRWADPALAEAGQLVVAVSRPGRQHRVAPSMIARTSGEFRARRGGRIDRYLETAVEPRPGVSGGLVLTADGAALGVAIAGLVDGAVMAIPHVTVERVVTALLAPREARGYLGIATVPVPLPAALRAATGEHLALLVTRVDPDSPAARAGILLGDALLSFGGATLQDASELLTLVAGDRIGDTVPMKLLRAGEVRDVQVTVGARPSRGCR